MKALDLRVGEKYRLVRRIGEGSYGAVYEGVDVETNQQVAIKLEHSSTYPSFLASEVQVYKDLCGGTGIPHVYWDGSECDYNVLVFELLGPSLEDLFNYCRRKFSLKTVLMLADQLIARLQYLHSRDVIHRDVKPENFLMGSGKSGNKVYVTDLGLAWSEFAVTSKKGKSLIGTARFASINGHRGNEQSSSDDLESVGYMLVYFLRGSLPWQGLRPTDEKDKDQCILEKKETTTAGVLCEGLPQEFCDYFNHLQRPSVKPNHGLLRKRFRDLFCRQGFEYDQVFDWTVLKYLATFHGDQRSGDESDDAQAVSN